MNPYNAKFPFDFMVKFSNKTWVDVIVMSAGDMFKDMSLNSELFTFEDDHHLQ